MTDLERRFAALGIEYAEGIYRSERVVLPNGREVRRRGSGWEVQPPDDNYWKPFPSLIRAVEFAMRKRGS